MQYHVRIGISSDKLYLWRTVKGNGFTASRLGINKISHVPKKIAEFLGLPNRFTGHCFRRSGATAVAGTGVMELELTEYSRWTNGKAAQRYIKRSELSRWCFYSRYSRALKTLLLV